MWQFEREIDLLKFYYPTKVKLDNEITVISDLDGFKYAGNFLIQGTVGQGKSIFLRYLTAIELLKRRSIPLSITLYTKFTESMFEDSSGGFPGITESA